MARIATLVLVLAVALLASLAAQPALAQAPTGTQERNITIPTQSSAAPAAASSASSGSVSSAASSGLRATSANGTAAPAATGNSTRNGTVTSSSSSSSSTSTGPLPTATFAVQSGQAPAPATGNGGKVAQSPDDSYIAAAERKAVFSLVMAVSLAASLAWVTL